MSDIVSDQNGLMTVRISTALIDFLKHLRWSQTVSGAARLEVGQLLKLRDGARLSPYVGFYKGDQLPEMGAFSYSSSAFDRFVSIGAYCSISWNVRVMGPSHPLDCFSTSAALYQSHPIFKSAYEDAGVPAQYRPNPQKSMPVIGNDVWIGQDVLLGRGITIGDGAVIAAGSTVVKSVLPYQIVGGTPAKLIRYRFPKASQAALQRSRWWEYPMPALMAFPVNDIPKFSAAVEKDAAAAAISKIPRFDISLAQIIRSGELNQFLSEDFPGLAHLKIS